MRIIYARSTAHQSDTLHTHAAEAFRESGQQYGVAVSAGNRVVIFAVANPRRQALSRERSEVLRRLPEMFQYLGCHCRGSPPKRRALRAQTLGLAIYAKCFKLIAFCWWDHTEPR